MKRFNLDTWLQNKSRKICTRDGRIVRIICTDANEETPIAALVTVNDMGRDKLATALYTKDGRYGGGNSYYDLFFADEDDELTELQKTLEEDCDCYVNLYNDGTTREELREWIKCWCNSIIDLARKEIEKENPSNGNQKQEWSEEDENMLLDIINDTEQGALLDKEQINWLKSIKDKVQLQPKHEWSEEDEKNWRHCLHYIDAYVTPVKEHVDWYKNIRNRIHSQPQQKQDWSEEDEKMWSQVINEIEAIKSNSSTIFEKNIAQDKIDWLKSIKDRVHPKQELNEEDEKKINGLVKGLEDRMGFGWANQPFTREEYIDWLKSLKDRIQPQPHWKPSKKQLMVLKDLLSGTYSIEHNETYQTIESLYQDLKNYNYGKI